MQSGGGRVGTVIGQATWNTSWRHIRKGNGQGKGKVPRGNDRNQHATHIMTNRFEKTARSTKTRVTSVRSVENVQHVSREELLGRHRRMALWQLSHMTDGTRRRWMVHMTARAHHGQRPLPVDRGASEKHGRPAEYSEQDRARNSSCHTPCRTKLGSKKMIWMMFYSVTS